MTIPLLHASPQVIRLRFARLGLLARLARLARIASFGSPVLLVLGCLDLTPFHVDNEFGSAGGASGGGVGDASAVDGAGSLARPCQSCYLEVPRCVDALAVCEKTPRCGQFVECLLNKGCFEGGPGQAANLCALPCALQSGITTPTDDAITNATVLTNCSEQMCPGICFPSQ